jgi:hypothetical protein
VAPQHDAFDRIDRMLRQIIWMLVGLYLILIVILLRLFIP